MKTTFEIVMAESKATAAALRGDHRSSLHLWEHVAACWQAKADHAARYGETAISDLLANETRRALHKADAQRNWIACEGSPA